MNTGEIIFQTIILNLGHKNRWFVFFKTHHKEVTEFELLTTGSN